MDVPFFIKHFFTMLVVCNPLIAIPVFLNLTVTRTRKEKHAIAIWSGISVGLILVITTFIGDPVLDFLGISIGSFECAGAIVIFLMALSMLNAEVSPMRQNAEESDYNPPNIAVVPLAIPLMAGPGAFSAVIIATRNYPSVLDLGILSLAGICVGAVVTFVLYFAVPIESKLGNSGLNILTRVAGLLIAALSMEIFFRGLVALGVPLLTS